MCDNVSETFRRDLLHELLADKARHQGHAELRDGCKEDAAGGARADKRETGKHSTASLTEEAERVREINCRITNSGQASAAPWSHESFDAWAQWTTSKCSVHSVDADHIGAGALLLPGCR